MNYYKENTYVGDFESPGYSLIRMSYYMIYLTLDFTPWLRWSKSGKSIYDIKSSLSTSIDTDGANYFYQIIMSIIREETSDKVIEAPLSCKNNTTLTLHYQPDEKKQMNAFLTIEKNDQVIAYRFATRLSQNIINNQLVTKVIQVELCNFAVLLIEYLISRLPAEEVDNPNHQLRIDWKEIIEYLEQ